MVLDKDKVEPWLSMYNELKNKWGLKHKRVLNRLATKILAAVFKALRAKPMVKVSLVKFHLAPLEAGLKGLALTFTIGWLEALRRPRGSSCSLWAPDAKERFYFWAYCKTPLLKL